MKTEKEIRGSLFLKSVVFTSSTVSLQLVYQTYISKTHGHHGKIYASLSHKLQGRVKTVVLSFTTLNMECRMKFFCLEDTQEFP